MEARANMLDAIVGWLDPARGAKRIRHRAAMDVLRRSYDGATRNRLNSSWSTPSTSADTEIAQAGRLLRDRMRDLVRNNPHAANALAVLVTHAIGDGIVPRSKDKKVNALFEEWSKQCDADGHLDFYGIQSLVAREMFESGDGIIRRRRRRLEDRLPVPLQLQVIETDLIDSTKEGKLSNGSQAIQGIEFDGIGRRRAYWMFAAHPGNLFFDHRLQFASQPILATDIVHVFEKQRTQVKGVPWGAPVITSLRDLATYEHAEIVRKKLEACLVGVMTGGDVDDAIGIEVPGIYNAQGERVERFDPGMFYNAVGGTDIKFSQPAATGSYDPYKTSMLHTIAAGFRVPFALLSGRLDKINYSSSKIGLEGFKRTISALQWQLFIPMLCQPVWDWFCEAAYLAGKIDSPNVQVEWSPPRFYSADPGRDVAARIAEVRAGFRPLPEVIAEGGYNPDDVLDDIAETNEKLDKLGLILDSDPRRISKAGQSQLPITDPSDEQDGEE